MNGQHALRRSTDDRWIGGVCGGIAEFFGFRSDVVRIVYLLVSIASVGFPGTLVYIILWLLIPERGRY